MLLLGATSFFEIADPRLDSDGDFPRSKTAGLFQTVEFLLFHSLSFMFDNSDPGIHDFSPDFVNLLSRCDLFSEVAAHRHQLV